MPGAKRPALSRWTEVAIDEAAVTRWTRQYPDHGIGLRTGALVGIDIDVLDPDVAHQVDQLVRSRSGDTLMRVGLWPKRLLLYRTEQPFPKMSVRGIEVLGAGQQFVAFGVHPDTGAVLRTGPLGETPLEVAFEDLPLVDAAACEQMLAEASALLPPPAGIGSSPGERFCRRWRRRPVRDADGRVTDGRDGWLSRIAFHAVSDAVGAWRAAGARRHLRRRSGSGSPPPATCRGRGRAASRPTLTPTRRGRWPISCASWPRAGLPSREPPAVEAEYRAPTLSAGEARQRARPAASERMW